MLARKRFPSTGSLCKMKKRGRQKKLALLTALAMALAGCGAMHEEIQEGMTEISETPLKVVEVRSELPPQPPAEVAVNKDTSRSWRDGSAVSGFLHQRNTGLKGIKKLFLGEEVPDGMERVGRTGEREERLLDEVKRVYKGLPGVDPELTRLAVTTGTLFTVQFGVRDYSLNKAASELVKKNGAWLKASPEADIFIAGYTGEAGSRDYNVSLGHRRVEAVKTFLTDMGVEGSRVRLMSYGAESPIDKRNIRDAAERNSRVEFIIIY